MNWLPEKTTAIKRRNGLQKFTYRYRSTSLIISIYFDRIAKVRELHFNERYLTLEKTEINETTSLEQSPRKILYAYDCESILLYENQEGCILDYPERKLYWGLPIAMSPESFVRGAVSTPAPEQSTCYSDACISATQSAETIDLVAQISFKQLLQMQLAMPEKKKTTVSTVLLA